MLCTGEKEEEKKDKLWNLLNLQNIYQRFDEMC